MSAEMPGKKAESTSEERVNWNEILRNSYLFSQGEAGLQNEIFKWLATGPFTELSVTKNDFKKRIVSTYAHTLDDARVHTGVSGDMGEETLDEVLRRGELVDTLELKELLGKKGEVLRRLTQELLSRDFEMLKRRAELLPEDTVRDRNTSFFVDFGLLKKGTGPWSYDALPDVYKQMWEEVVSYATTSGLHRDSRFHDVCAAYVENHPNMNEEDKKVLACFILGSEEYKKEDEAK
jgi:hypothetical protein